MLMLLSDKGAADRKEGRKLGHKIKYDFTPLTSVCVCV